MPESEPKDPRSTGRKRARKVLIASGRPYACECDGSCGRENCEGTPEEKCGVSPLTQSRSDTLDADHKNKNILDNDPSNLWWLCRPCHRAHDRQTEKGESRQGPDEYGYGLDLLDLIPEGFGDSWGA